MYEISVIVPVYNTQEHISCCIEGLLGQDYPKNNFEVILVDNNSTDNSVAIAKQYDGIKLLSETKQGSYAARNCGIKAATGNILAFIDSDCKPEPNWLSSIASTMQNSDVSLLLGKRRYASSGYISSLIEKYEFEKIAYITNKEIKELYFGYTNNMAVRRELFDQLGLFQERSRGADTTFVRQVVDKFGCQVVKCISEMEILHLEINKVTDYYKKCLTYGKSNQFNCQSNGHRPLLKSENFQVYRLACQRHKMSYKDQFVLLLTLILGAISYSSGQYISRAVIQINKLFPKSNLKQDVV